MLRKYFKICANLVECDTYRHLQEWIMPMGLISTHGAKGAVINYKKGELQIWRGVSQNHKGGGGAAKSQALWRHTNVHTQYLDGYNI